MVHAARAEPRLRHREALAPRPSRLSAGTRTSRSRISQCPSGELCCMIGMLRTTRQRRACPSAPAPCCGRRGAIAVARRPRCGTSRSAAGNAGCAAPVMNHLRPLITQLVALAPHRGLQVGGVGRGDVGLGHGEGRADLALPAAASATRCVLRGRGERAAAAPCCRCPARCS